MSGGRGIPLHGTFFVTGGTERSAQDKMAEVLSVKDYGATGDGTTDDTAAIAAAYAAIPSSGGTMVFPPGTYRFNLTILKGGVVLRGSGSGNVNTGLGGTVLKPTNFSIPLIQIGDGTTTLIRGIAINDLVLLGDGTNATGDGVYIHGARDVTLFNCTITAFGRDNVSIDSSATVESSGIYIVSSAISNGRRTGIRAIYGTQYVTNLSTVNCHINGWNSPATAIYLDSVTLWMTATYVDIPGSASGHVVMVKNYTPNPNIIANSVSFDNAAGAAATTLDVSGWLPKASRMSSAIHGNFLFVGDVIYSDATIQQPSSRGSYLYQPMLLNPYVHNTLYMPLDETDGSTAVGFVRSGTSGGHSEAIQVVGSTRFISAFQCLKSSPTYSASMTLDLQIANIFEITATNGTAFAIATTHVAQNQVVYIRIKNASGGALGAVTFTGINQSGFVDPGNGNGTTASFAHDGTAIKQLTPWTPAIPN